MIVQCVVDCTHSLPVQSQKVRASPKGLGHLVQTSLLKKGPSPINLRMLVWEKLLGGEKPEFSTTRLRY